MKDNSNKFKPFPLLLYIKSYKILLVIIERLISYYKVLTRIFRFCVFVFTVIVLVLIFVLSIHHRTKFSMRIYQMTFYYPFKNRLITRLVYEDITSKYIYL